jgi:hypothetical protein
MNRTGAADVVKLHGLAEQSAVESRLELNGNVESVVALVSQTIRRRLNPRGLNGAPK